MKLFAKKIFKTIEDVYSDMQNKKNDYYNHKIDKYVVSYTIKDKDHIEVMSNIGRTRIVKNNNRNRRKLDQVVVRSKVEIARKIDKYEKDASERLTLLIIHMILLSLSFATVFGALFTGSYYILLFSLLTFSLIITLTANKTYNYYFLVKEIRSLKKVTGYKMDMEMEFPKLKIENFVNKVN